jgi:hypothetical protein
MGTSFQPATPVLTVSKIKMKWRIVFAVMVIMVCAIVDILMTHFGSHPTVVIDLIFVIVCLVIVFRPQWIDRWNAKNLEQTEKSGPDLRQWM